MQLIHDLNQPSSVTPGCQPAKNACHFTDQIMENFGWLQSRTVGLFTAAFCPWQLHGGLIGTGGQDMHFYCSDTNHYPVHTGPANVVRRIRPKLWQRGYSFDAPGPGSATLRGLTRSYRPASL